MACCAQGKPCLFSALQLFNTKFKRFFTLFQGFPHICQRTCYTWSYAALRLKYTLKWLVIPLLILVVFSALILVSSSATTQDPDGSKGKTEDLFFLFQQANNTVIEIFSQFKADGETIPQESLNEYNQALLLAEESQTLLQAGNYSQANGRILHALQKLKDALRIAYTTLPVAPVETDLEKAAELQSSIERYLEQLQRIENLTRLAADAGYNTTTFEENIQTVKSLLDKASSNIKQKRFEAASGNLAEAENLSDRLLAFLNNFAADLKTQRLQTYISQAETRLAAIREKAESVSNTASLAALDNAEVSLGNAKEYLEDQQINETLNALTSSKQSEDEAVEYLQIAASSTDTRSAPTSIETP
jgi:primosomal protein N''